MYDKFLKFWKIPSYKHIIYHSKTHFDHKICRNYLLDSGLKLYKHIIIDFDSKLNFEGMLEF